MSYGSRYGGRYGGHGHGHGSGSYSPQAGGYGGGSAVDVRPRASSGSNGALVGGGAGIGAGAGASGIIDERYADPSNPPSSRSPHREKRWARRAESVHDTAAKNFMVVIRVRPPLPREMNGDRPFQNVVRVDQSERVITISENLNASLEDAALAGAYTAHTFTFDRVYDQNCTQRKVYETTAKAVVESSLQGCVYVGVVLFTRWRCGLTRSCVVWCGVCVCVCVCVCVVWVCVGACCTSQVQRHDLRVWPGACTCGTSCM